MIVYKENKRQFKTDVMNGEISQKIYELLTFFHVAHVQPNEIAAWKNSLRYMKDIIDDEDISNEVEVAIEFQIPLTSKRVDFMIAGQDMNSNDNVVVVELKQWDKCEATNLENVVKAYTGGALREVVHPSQQAYAYAKLIENFNESIQDLKVNLLPCTYLHNYEDQYKYEILDPRYDEIVKLAPVFLMKDGLKLTDYIKKYIRKPSNNKLFELVEYGKLRPSKALQDSVGSILNGNKEFEMIDEQQVAYATIMNLFEESFKDDKKHTIIVKGGPGTGKSVIAINLLAKMIEKSHSCVYVSKNSAPRAAFSQKLLKGKYSLSYLKGLFMGSGKFYNVKKNQYDCILCDEAHRLNEKSGMFSNLGENQIKEIINASKISVFFIDEDQIISSKDIGSIEEIKKWAIALGSQIHDSKDLELVSQFRCNGSDGYLAFLDDVLEIRETANYNFFDLDYDIQIFDHPSETKDALEKKNDNNKARMIAGYCYEWKSHKDKTQFDIDLDNHRFIAQWNFTTDKFAIDPNSFEQVGCIHSTQGLEFDYVGIIIGQDLRYENGHVITDVSKRDKGDHTIRGLKNNPRLADRIIRNTYKTLLSRAKYGCYIYCEDKELSEYLKKRIANAKNMKELVKDKYGAI